MKLGHLTLPIQSWQPGHPTADIELGLWFRFLDGVNVVKRSRLDNDNVFEGVQVSDLRNGAPAIATERISQRHPTVLLGCVRLGRARGDAELVLGHEYVGRVRAATKPAAGEAVTDRLDC